MNTPRYTLGTGFWHADNHEAWLKADVFFQYWCRNLPDRRISTKTFVICVGTCRPQTSGAFGVQFATLDGNLGHVGQLLNGEKPYSLCGWSASVLTLALLAYQNETDLIYKEQDCLAFGPWVERMYSELGDGQMIFGKKHESAPFMPCSQSLFLIKHAFLLTFISDYLALGTDADHGNLPETKFVRIEEKHGTEKIKRISWGCDRERPIPYDADVFYCQQIQPDEMQELKKRGLI